jgi:hypothetical protein
VLWTYNPIVKVEANELYLENLLPVGNNSDTRRLKPRHSTKELIVDALNSPNITAKWHNLHLASTKEQRHGHKPEKYASLLSR